jgi:hypothetical protein
MQGNDGKTVKMKFSVKLQKSPREMDCPLCSPDLAPVYFWLFPKLMCAESKAFLQH